MNTAEATMGQHRLCMHPLSLAETCIEMLNFFTKPIAFCSKRVKLALQLSKPFLLSLQFAPKRFHILRIPRVFQRFRPLSHALNKLDLAGLSMHGISDLAFQPNQKHTKMRRLRLAHQALLQRVRVHHSRWACKVVACERASQAPNDFSIQALRRLVSNLAQVAMQVLGYP